MQIERWWRSCGGLWFNLQGEIDQYRVSNFLHYNAWLQEQPSWQPKKISKGNSLQTSQRIPVEKQGCGLNKENREQIHDKNINKNR